MGQFSVSESNLTSIANAIRTKGGTGSPLSFPEGFISAIGSIPTSETVLVSKTITENGTYDPENDNADGYSSVTVAVPQATSPLVKVGTYTVQESWESNQTGYTMLQAALDGYLSSNAVLYVLVFNNNTNTSSYRVDMIVLLTNVTTVQDITTFGYGSAWKNYYTSVGTLGGTLRASQGTVIDIYRFDNI